MIHKYQSNGYNIVLDVNSGAVHIVDDIAFKLLDYVKPPLNKECPSQIVEMMLSQYSKEDIKQAYLEICDLQSQGLLFSDDDYIEISKRIGHASPVKALCLHVAHDCNMRCEYCFASTGDFNQGRNLMDIKVAKASIDFVINHSDNRRNIEIDFFGGEPLMNFDVVKDTVAYARSLEDVYNKKFRFTITTNGLLLDDEKLKFINENMSNLVLSIDGRKKTNDRVRKLLSGDGCYDIVMPKLIKAAQSRNQDNYYVRATFTKYNLDFSNDVLHFADMGFKQVSAEPVTCDERELYSISKEDLPIIFSEYDKLAQEMLKRKSEGKGFNFFHFMIDLSQGPCVIKRLHGCGSGNEYVAVTPQGDIYPCHQFVGQDDYKMGSVLDGTFDNDIKAKFAASNVYSKEDCKNCWAKFYCSGGCCANNYKYSKNINTPYFVACEMEKKRIECAVMMKIAQTENCSHL